LENSSQFLNAEKNFSNNSYPKSTRHGKKGGIPPKHFSIFNFSKIVFKTQTQNTFQKLYQPNPLLLVFFFLAFHVFKGDHL
jgi:hypothetical protein